MLSIVSMSSAFIHAWHIHIPTSLLMGVLCQNHLINKIRKNRQSVSALAYKYHIIDCQQLFIHLKNFTNNPHKKIGNFYVNRDKIR